MKIFFLSLFYISSAYSNRAMQEAMQGKVNSDIFNNNSYQCKVVTNTQSSMMNLAFKRGHFRLSHLSKKKKIVTLWFGEYKLLKVGQVLFKTKEFTMKDSYGVIRKKDGEVLFNVSGNASLFKLKSDDVKYICTRNRF